MRRILKAVLVMAGVLALVLAGGFVSFTRSLVTDAPETPSRADGIVVLTGGAARIDMGLTLLAREKGGRLLISGVNPKTTRSEIQANNTANAAMFECCIDLGREARTTIGNASETAEWIRQHKFDSVIVVTSSYHMPRAMMEFRRLLEDVDLTAYPVVANGRRLDRWWADMAVFRLLLSEYSKYALAFLRIHVIEPYLPFLLTATDLQHTN